MYNVQLSNIHKDAPMADPLSADQRLFQAFQQVADVLLPLKNDLRHRVYATVGTFFGFAAQPAGSVEINVPPPTGRRPKQPQTKATPTKATPKVSRDASSPKDFLAEKQPNTDVERVACLAYYITHHRSTKQFKAAELDKLSTEAGQGKFANATTSVNNATRARHLVAVSRGLKRLSPEGERYVDALPDRAAAKAALRRKAKSSSRKGAAAKRTPAKS